MFSIRPSLLNRKVLSPVLLTAALTLTGCFTSSEEEAGDPVDFTPVLTSVGENVIYPTYADLFEKAKDLDAAVQALDTTVQATRMGAARAAWRAARAPWEQSEGFLFGPVDTKGIDPSIDSWPLDSASLKNILSGGAMLDVTYITAQADEVKGFHAIEYLLFGVDSTKTRLTTRELAYVKAAATAFKVRTGNLEAAWNPAGENFLAQFTTAGTGSTAYRSKRAAAEELLDGMVAICDEVGAGKITEPYNHGPDKEESRFSRNSTSDFANNIRSVRNVWTGSYGVRIAKGAFVYTPGFSVWVDSVDAPLALRVHHEIDSAISKIEQVGDFTAALTANRPKIAAARTAVLTLMHTLDQDVRKALFP
jgi:putative iron-regulated protein